MKKSIFLFILSIITLNLGATNTNSIEKISITGKVIDKDTKQPLEYATIVIKSLDGKIITGGITDVKGEFNIQVAKGVYDISIEFISFKTKTFKSKEINGNTDLGTIILEVDAQTLNEVEIIAEKSTVEIRLDKKIYNVGKDMTVKGGTASDVLDNVPSVSVDVEGNVSLRGSENVRILINGKP
ncbi:MAG: carboxypeptidase-like regulatory domain-containing protein, partial [Lutibacter sp.]